MCCTLRAGWASIPVLALLLGLGGAQLPLPNVFRFCAPFKAPQAIRIKGINHRAQPDFVLELFRGRFDAKDVEQHEEFVIPLEFHFYFKHPTTAQYDRTVMLASGSWPALSHWDQILKYSGVIDFEKDYDALIQAVPGGYNVTLNGKYLGSIITPLSVGPVYTGAVIGSTTLRSVTGENGAVLKDSCLPPADHSVEQSEPRPPLPLYRPVFPDDPDVRRRVAFGKK